MAAQRNDRFDEDTLVLILQHVAEFFPRQSPEQIESVREARLLISQLLDDVAEVPHVNIDRAVEQSRTGWLLIEELQKDPEVSTQLSRLIHTPPSRDQAAGETVVLGAAVLGALIAWLQTKITIHVSRKDGRTAFDLSVTKATTPPATLNQVISVLKNVFSAK
jgi:hypothetical protein